MTAADLLAELRKLDVHVVLDGDRLRLNAPVGVLTDEHKRDLAQRKPEVIAFLREAQRLASQQRAIVPLESAGRERRSSPWPGTTATCSPIARSRSISARISHSSACSRPDSRKAANR